MNIAVTHENGEVFQNLKKLKEIIIFTEKDGKIISEKILKTAGYEGEALASLLIVNDVDVFISGGTEGKLLNTLLSVKIRVYPGVKGKCRTAAEEYICGNMEFEPNFSCHH